MFLVGLDPTRRQEIRTTRPCLVISPDELNEYIQTVIVAPLTTGSRAYPFRVACTFQGKRKHIVLDQLRTVDRTRLFRRLGTVTASVVARSLGVLQEMFAP
ncbi:type II toxin-antitoxin system PemK/MazF family toxin [Candidatus Fermentibacteria bacterium]|nr:type II toxin-antitoxin system PemK/MazF family toxin [Candidatus Fermentibacteria bacterium]